MSTGNATSSRFRDIQAKCLSAGMLYEDPEFPAVPKSVYFSKRDPNIQWRRPSELCRQPFFIDKEGASRFDLDQGALGDCWFIAAAATLACHPDLFKVVVPDDQGFDASYAGVFHFKFWCFGEWQDVIIDDRLPTVKGPQGRQLVFCSNRQKPTEFWPALLEKAYAKLCGSYEALDGGWTEDGLVDFTGGIGHRIDLTKRNELPPDFFEYLLKLDHMRTLMGCSIHATRETMEDQLPNGLMIGHAYSVTRVLQISIKGKPIQILRLRNPWGIKEWNGPWSDRSKEWLRLDPKTRQDLGVVIQEDGEFWLPFEDWLANFHMLQLCYLPPDASYQEKEKNQWKEVQFNGSWVPGVNSGGSSQPYNSEQFWANAQYSVMVKPPERHVLAPSKSKSVQPDSSRQTHATSGCTNPTIVTVGTGSAPCTLIVSLMQKNNRRNRTLQRVQTAEVAMSFDLYKSKTAELPETLSMTHYDKYALQLARKGDEYQYYREISQHFHVDPGVYVVVPSTFDYRAQADYLLRIYTDSGIDGREMDAPTEPIRINPLPAGETLQDLFTRYAGSDGVIDYRELQQILNQSFSKELGTDHVFDLETCRSLLSMLDARPKLPLRNVRHPKLMPKSCFKCHEVTYPRPADIGMYRRLLTRANQSGVLEFKEMQALWTELNTWKKTFSQFDKDSSGYIDVSELKSIFNSIGYRLSRVALTSVIRRFGGKEGKLWFNDFVLAVTKIVSLIEKFPQLSNDGLKGKTELTLDEWLPQMFVVKQANIPSFLVNS